MLLKPEVVPDGQEGSQKIIRLWIHEVYRVFYDRLVDETDRDLFFNMVKVRQDCVVMISWLVNVYHILHYLH